ncbi:hypothetical protein [Cylindrospermopsis raciborskii]|nr:hypothetical protein [Cylindrospermopsis raciborskii]MCZ2207255.1 hypothetical protein [Cylindrospermopsis raciborskii PAMP2011]
MTIHFYNSPYEVEVESVLCNLTSVGVWFTNEQVMNHCEGACSP